MKKKIAIVGGGACALILACELDSQKFDVSVYEKNTAPGRKFLVAGEGGLNLTHSEDRQKFISRYTPSGFLEDAFGHFSNKHFVQWINALGVETFVGTSGRVFPKRGTKPIEVLNKILDKIKSNDVTFFTKHNWKGFENESLVFENQDQSKLISSDLVVFCLGGTSWPVTGSTGEWADLFRKEGVKINPFLASNCTFCVDWPIAISAKTEGKIMKNISITCGNKTNLGEVVITKSGIEGSGIYPFSPQIRERLQKTGKAEMTMDFKPALSPEKIAAKINAKSSTKNLTEHLKTELKLSEAQVALLKNLLSKEDYLDTEVLAKHIKNFKITITGTGPITEAISTVGGVALGEIDEHFQLKKLQGCFAIGEMLDYDAPTGGYLLQSCFSMAKFLADKLNANHL